MIRASEGVRGMLRGVAHTMKPAARIMIMYGM